MDVVAEILWVFVRVAITRQLLFQHWGVVPNGAEEIHAYGHQPFIDCFLIRFVVRHSTMPRFMLPFLFFSL